MRKQEYTWKPSADSTRPVRWGQSLKIRTEERFAFHVGPLPSSNWSLERMVFRMEENRRTRRKALGKKQDPTKKSAHMSWGRHRTRATLVGGERSHHCSTLLSTSHPNEICRSRISGLEQRRSKKLETSIDISHSYLSWSHLFSFGLLSIQVITIATICSIKVFFLQTAKENFLLRCCQYHYHFHYQCHCHCY